MLPSASKLPTSMLDSLAPQPVLHARARVGRRARVGWRAGGGGRGGGSDGFERLPCMHMRGGHMPSMHMPGEGMPCMHMPCVHTLGVHVEVGGGEGQSRWAAHKLMLSWVNGVAIGAKQMACSWQHGRALHTRALYTHNVCDGIAVLLHPIAFEAWHRYSR
eukprot:366260-Chlamydomonas_euryale.AAC.50